MARGLIDLLCAGRPAMFAGVIFVGAGLGTGCGGGVTSRRGEVTSTTAAIRAAEEVGAKNTPRSALHLKYARDQLKEAQGLLAEGRRDEGGLVLLRAEADAELALAIARESVARREAQRLVEEVEDLKKKESTSR